MKSAILVGLLSLFLLSACSTMGRPYVAGDNGCDEIVDARARLDCYEQADKAEDKWREELKRKEDEKDKDKDETG